MRNVIIITCASAFVVCSVVIVLAYVMWDTTAPAPQIIAMTGGNDNVQLSDAAEGRRLNDEPNDGENQQVTDEPCDPCEQGKKIVNVLDDMIDVMQEQNTKIDNLQNTVNNQSQNLDKLQTSVDKSNTTLDRLASELLEDGNVLRWNTGQFGWSQTMLAPEAEKDFVDNVIPKVLAAATANPTMVIRVVGRVDRSSTKSGNDGQVAVGKGRATYIAKHLSDAGVKVAKITWAYSYSPNQRVVQVYVEPPK